MADNKGKARFAASTAAKPGTGTTPRAGLRGVGREVAGTAIGIRAVTAKSGRFLLRGLGKIKQQGERKR